MHILILIDCYSNQCEQEVNMFFNSFCASATPTTLTSTVTDTQTITNIQTVTSTSTSIETVTVTSVMTTTKHLPVTAVQNTTILFSTIAITTTEVVIVTPTIQVCSPKVSNDSHHTALITIDSASILYTEWSRKYKN